MNNSIKKLSRICWNSNNWKKPSGYEGKSKNKNSYEYHYGFGHEEWIFDTSKIIDGYHYAYLQSVFNHGNRECVYDISLYTIKTMGNKKVRYWLGEIIHVEAVNPEESKRILKIYKEKGWYDEMKTQLEAVDADSTEFDRIKKDDFFVIKFKPENLILVTPYSFPYTDPAVPSNYYNLLNYRCQPSFSKLNNTFDFVSGNNDKKGTGNRRNSGIDIEIEYLHNDIQSGIYNSLCLEYGSENVGTENNTGYNSRVDIVVRLNKSSFYFYEIKTNTSVLACIREAIGQVIEYVHFRDNPVNVDKMFIIGIYPPNEDEVRYMKTLREEYNIPIYYRQCFTKNNYTLSKEY
ncbi:MULTISPECIES: hypothetical protein [Pectobacterium]|uniref:hypothetical protein n=1 Tax=Pectobacterium TaxID=122277 RepID=UPI000EB2AEA9|nr:MULTISPECIES: hypothetical protein [Pectobacterium]AYH27066.1 hypothetical protein C5E20_07925 [Pectobacterium parmentieri]MCA6960988.1 hypothetical protein [Pectobacterium odoriferum]MCH5009099.1 hypothetical protein [Pectobacterium odoriferum]